jgi:His/Glu/Gln/Arg/opine family amino acid ABC transporter permease subunit
VRFLRVFGQVVFVALLLALLVFLYENMRAGLARQGLTTGFDFLRLTASFDLGESVIRFSAADTYARAFLAGILNTLRVAVIGIVLATVVGVLAGVARISPNWLLRQAATVYVELIRNTPLLVQLFFWYFGIVLQLPPVRQAAGHRLARAGVSHDARDLSALVRADGNVRRLAALPDGRHRARRPRLGGDPVVGTAQRAADPAVVVRRAAGRRDRSWSHPLRRSPSPFPNAEG